MSKLYPPVIAGTLPAFYGDVLNIPFEMNRAVNRGEVYGFSLKIKTVQNSFLIGTVAISLNQSIFKDHVVSFNLNEAIWKKLNIGQYYKIQMAYKDKSGIVGHYSSVGVIKYTTKPDVAIIGLDSAKNNNHQYYYEGSYQQISTKNPDIIKDSTEKLYSYQYELYDNNYKILMRSDETIYNSSYNDEPNSSTFSFKINQDLDSKKKYYLRLKVITSNKMEVYSDYYPIIQRFTINSDAKISLQVDSISELENGGIKINLIGEINKKTGLEETVVGSFRLIRTDEKSNFSAWEDILDFNLYALLRLPS